MKRRGAVTAKAGGGLAAIAVLTTLDRPALALLALTATLVVGAVCWVVADPARARNLALLIHVALGGDRRRPPR